MPHDEALCNFHKLATTLQHLHFKHIIHRDIKPGNILFTKCGELKICDFGSACDTLNSLHLDEKILETGFWTAPQVEHSTVEHLYKKDVYSLGLVLLVMLNGYPLLNSWIGQGRPCITAFFTPSSTLTNSIMLKDISRMIEPSPVKRCSLEYITQQTWFKDIPTCSAHKTLGHNHASPTPKLSFFQQPSETIKPKLPPRPSCYSKEHTKHQRHHSLDYNRERA